MSAALDVGYISLRAAGAVLLLTKKPRTEAGLVCESSEERT
jgi:hypothetical protein